MHLSPSRRSWLPASLSATIIAAIIAGCGGSSSGPQTPSPTPTPLPDPGATPLPGPTPTPLPVGNCTNNTFRPNYAAEIDPLLRWPGFPLRVFFVRDGEYSITRQNIAQAGFDQWTQATGNRAVYQVVTVESQADVVVRFGTFTSGQTLGETVVFFRSNIIESSEMTILFTGQLAQDQLTAAHEWGHALGIMDHSSNPADMMNAFGNPNGCSCVTQSDLNTLLTAYCNDFSTRTLPRRREELGPLRSIRIN